MSLTVHFKNMEKMTIKELLGARVKELRKRKNLSQEKLAEEIGIDPKHLSRIEVGRSYPSINTLEKLASVLDVELKDLFDFAHEAPVDQLRQNLIHLLSNTSEEKLRLALKVLRAIII